MASAMLAIEDRREWRAACDVQQRFMQRLAPPAIESLDYSARCRQLDELGGDCYDFIALPENRLALAVGDASGKGLAAALMISSVQSSLRTAAMFSGDNVAAVLGAVNRQVYGSSLAERYATLFYGVFDATTRILRYVNAGHNPPIVIRRNRAIVRLETGGAPVGLFAEWPYEEGSVQLRTGDLFLAYTDGIIEATNPHGEEWGIERLRGALAHDYEIAGDVVNAIFTALDEFSGGRQSDDATVVVLRVS